MDGSSRTRVSGRETGTEPQVDSATTAGTNPTSGSILAEAAAAGPAVCRRGRPRDAALDATILDAARALVTERGFDGTTMDAVAARAGTGKATLYRRWGSKTDLVVDAVACAKPTLGVEDVPDTGSLRGDLDAARRLMHHDTDDALVSALLSEVRREPLLAQSVHERAVASKVRLMRGLLERAERRGEVPPGRDLDLLAAVVPAMVSYHRVIAGLPADREFLDRVLGEVLVPLATGPR
ncbi:TetR family transcriptional regulator [Cellulomonas sp. PhB143]|nr:TetR family transcriptional regulator [Cellulomonas sp. PhB143]